MKVVFRTDASLQIGTGHVMRCLTLANALRALGAECRFVCREHSGNLIELIRKQGFATVALPLPNVEDHLLVHANEQPLAHASWLGSDWLMDSEQTTAGAGGTTFDWLIVDHYGIDARWERRLRPTCRGLMVIDDITDRTHDCDLLLNQNLGRVAVDYDGLIPPACRVLVGPRYALLRPEFAEFRPRSLERRASPRLEHLLISMGGVDKDNVTGMMLDVLRDCPLPASCRISVVMGPHAPWLEQIRKQASSMQWATEVLLNVDNMAEIMSESDLAIGAAGSTSWERCALGLPTIIVILAENQQAIGRALDVAGAAKVVNLATLRTEIKSFFSQPDTMASNLASLAACAARVTDGTGSQAMVKMLFELIDI